jgi:hypothetical protein
MAFRSIIKESLTMKKISLSLVLCVAVIIAILGAAVVYAAPVYDRTTISLGTATGTAQWTNTWKYSAIELKRIWLMDSLATNATLTVTRITSDGTYTQAVGTATTAALTYGSTASFTASYLKYGDKLPLSSSATTGGVVMIEYEVQQ